MDNLHIGHTDDDNYSFFGKLSDGTPVYKFNPPPPPDPNILKEQIKNKNKLIEDFNTTTEVQYTDTSKFLQTFNEEQEKDRIKAEYISTVNERKVDSSVRSVTPDDHNVLNYIKNDDLIEEENIEESNIIDYLDLFHKEAEDDKQKELKKQLIAEQKQKLVEDEEARRQESAQKYIELLESIEDTEKEQVKQFELLIEQREQELQDDYEQLLGEKQVDLYTEDAEFDIKIDKQSKSVTVKNKDNKEKAAFNYLGDIVSATINGYKLRIYSVVEGDKEYGVIKESYRYITHRYMAYDLRTQLIIQRETFIVSKLDPKSVTLEDLDVYTDGYTDTNRSLSGYFQPLYYWDYPINTRIELEHFFIPDGDKAVKIIPTEIIVEARGAGGAGRDGLLSPGSTNGAPGGGGSYARKTIPFNPYQQYPVNIRVNVGDGAAAAAGAGQNDDTIFDNNYARPTKDTYIVIENVTGQTGTTQSELSTIAGGGYDGNNDDGEGNKAPGYPGKPMGDYDVGHYGAGFKPWSAWEFAVSGVTTEPDWDNFLTGMQSNAGFGANGALSAANGAGTSDPLYSTVLNIGTSGGWGGRDGTAPSLSGQTPTGGGGAGFGTDAASVTGSPGGNGILSIIVTKGIVEL